jgi:acyl-CoA ligase (AMP-forming) (exosortase A-associated)
MLLHDLILKNVDSRGDQPALLRGDESVSYSELGRQVRNVASGIKNTGTHKGDRIAVYLTKRFEGVISYFAASLSGGVFVPVNPVLKPSQVAHILRDCSVSVLVTTRAQLALLATELEDCDSVRTVVLVGEAGPDPDSRGHYRILDWTELSEDHRENASLDRAIDNDVAAVLYTSGSTGHPKGVVLSHRNMVAGAISVAGYIGNRADDRILAALPFSFDAGFSQLTTGFFAGAAVILLDYLLPKDVLKTASVQNATGLTGVPPLWNQLVALEWPQDVADNFRYIANTGGAMPTATLEKLRSNLPRSKVFLMYGLTEAFRSTYLPPEELDRRPTSIGKAIPNAEILVVREDGTRCSPGEPGELVHRGALVSLGYWNDPERTAQRFKPLPGQLGALPFAEMTVWSGDTVVTDEDGFIYFVGRRDDMIKSSGYRISPTEVEEVVYKTGLVSECAALGIPHPVIGQAVVVAAVGPSPDEATAAEIVKACREALPNFMVPQAIEWQIQMPKNPNGKIDRKSLVESLTDYYEETD